MNIHNVKLGEKLLNSREQNLLTIEQLSDLSNVDAQVIEEYESGNSKYIDSDIIEKLALVLKLDPTELISWRGDSLGDIIKNRRKELGMTQKDVASHVNVSHSAVSRWESGEIENITQDKIAGLAEILSISPLTLIAPDSSDTLYQVNQEYLNIAKTLQVLNIPIEICEQIVDIFKQLKNN